MTVPPAGVGSAHTYRVRFLRFLPAFSMVVLLASALACSNDDPMTFAIDFRQSSQGWVGDFADYPIGEDAFYELGTDHRALPEPLSGNGLYITGNNHSDDLWMYYKGRIAGLSPDTLYRVTFSIELATSVPNGCVGVGGAPGEDVTVKAGASTFEPGRVDEGGLWRMNVDKGQQSNGGEDAVVVGDIASSIPCGEDPRWELKQLSSDGLAVEVASGSAGAVWLFVGTDSGFEATSSVYYTQFTASFEPL
jgi:hypothetical protein